MEIRPAVATDEGAVIALWGDCGLLRPWNDPAADMAMAMASPSSVLLVGEDDGAIVATAMTGFDGHRGWTYYLAVAPARQRAGHGRAMMAACEAWLRERGAPKLQLMVRDGNASALAFYARLGLEPQMVTVLGKRLDDRLA
jgi:ribosomal protein S18 acetylase RimI-like enzyme